MTDFKVVEIPRQAATGATASIIEALQNALGKAIEVPLEKRDSNTVRKTIRAGLSNRKLLKEFKYNTLFVKDTDVLVVWLTRKVQ